MFTVSLLFPVILMGRGIRGALVPPIDKPMGLPIQECFSWTLVVYFLKIMNIYCLLTLPIRKLKQCLQTRRIFKDHRCNKVRLRLSVQSASTQEVCACASVRVSASSSTHYLSSFQDSTQKAVWTCDPHPAPHYGPKQTGWMVIIREMIHNTVCTSPLNYYSYIICTMTTCRILTGGHLTSLFMS